MKTAQITTADLKVGDVVSKPEGWGKWAKWEHRIADIHNGLVYSVFDNGQWRENQKSVEVMSIVNMDSCLKQPGTVVHRPQPDGTLKQVFPGVEDA